MEYRLDLLQTLEVMFIADNNISTLILILLSIGFPILMYLLMPKHSVKTLIIVTYVAIILGSDIPTFKSGWQINGNKLNINAYGNSANINIESMEICFVDINSEWSPLRRTNAAGYPRLSVGEYKLENKKKALVFNHYRQNKLLLISSENKYYLIGHPSICTLYEVLLRLGARKK